MTARLGIAIGRHWGGLVRAIDVINTVAAVGALGSLPALIQAITQFAMRRTKGEQK